MSALRGGGLLLPQQMEAIERVRQAQARAHQTVEQTNAQVSRVFEPAEVLEPMVEPVASAPSWPSGQSGQSGLGGGAFGGAPSRGSGPQNILSQLFGGGAGPGRPPQGRGTQGSSSRPMGTGANVSGAARTPGGGLFDLLRGKGLTDSVGSLGSLGDTLHSTLSSVSEPVAKLLDTFNIDGEKLIILLVMWVIFNERGDKTLLMALGYLLL